MGNSDNEYLPQSGMPMPKWNTYYSCDHIEYCSNGPVITASNISPMIDEQVFKEVGSDGFAFKFCKPVELSKEDAVRPRRAPLLLRGVVIVGVHVIFVGGRKTNRAFGEIIHKGHSSLPCYTELI